MRPSRAAFVSLLTTALVLLACLPGRAGADTIGITGLESGAYSTATFVVEFNPQTNTLVFTGTRTFSERADSGGQWWDRCGRNGSGAGTRRGVSLRAGAGRRVSLRP